jgi:hypothetical protein
MDNGELREEFGVDALFVGRRRDRPAPSFRVGRDVYAGYFLILRPSDDDIRPFWIARALTNVDAEPMEHPHWILIQYWKPSASSDNIQETYDPCNGRLMIRNLQCGSILILLCLRGSREFERAP